MATTRDIYQEITDRIIEALKQGVVPWIQPWTSTGPQGLPANASTERPYNGINVILLWLTAMERGYSDHRWLTFKQDDGENKDKSKLNNQLPYLVGNIVEILDVVPDEDEEEDGANVDLDSQRKGKCVVLKTSTRQTIFLPVVGLVDAETLKPGDLVGVNKDSYLILDTLPAEFDSRVKAMEVDEKPTEDYSDIGGLDKQIQELMGHARLDTTMVYMHVRSPVASMRPPLDML